jgi:hypothetical protein
MAVTINGSGQIVVQVKSFTLDTAVTSSSTSPVSIGLSVNITPTSASNKILIFADVFSSSNNQAYFILYRNSTPINPTAVSATHQMSFGSAVNANNYFAQAAHSFLDSPATTSALTYSVYLDTDGTVFINRRGADTYNGATSTITVMEISG